MKYTKFWTCYNPKKGQSAVQHETKEIAMAEAERLTRKEGVPIAILECVNYVMAAPAPVQVVDAEVENVN